MFLWDSTCLQIYLSLDHRPINTSFIFCSTTAWKQTSVAFNCSAVGSPSPTYVFYHNGKIIEKNKWGYHKTDVTSNFITPVVTPVSQKMSLVLAKAEVSFLLFKVSLNMIV